MSKISESMNKENWTPGTMPTALDRLAFMATTTEELEERVSRRFLINGLVQEKSHTIFYGASGTAKTTLTFYLIKEAKISNPELKTFYFLLDGSDQIALNGRRYYNDEGLTMLLSTPAKEIISFLELAISGKEDLNNKLFIFDTYKKFQTDVNNKADNARHLHFIRELTNRGATVISIAHSNKNREQISGTAELEQDSDAVMRFDKLDDAGDPDGMFVSISADGRVRWKPEERSFKVPRYDPDPAKVKDVDYVDLSQADLFAKHGELIADIRAYLDDNGDTTQKQIVADISEEAIEGRDAITKILKAGAGLLWKRSKGSKNSSIYEIL